MLRPNATCMRQVLGVRLQKSSRNMYTTSSNSLSKAPLHSSTLLSSSTLRATTNDTWMSGGVTSLASLTCPSPSTTRNLLSLRSPQHSAAAQQSHPQSAAVDIDETPAVWSEDTAHMTPRKRPDTVTMQFRDRLIYAASSEDSNGITAILEEYSAVRTQWPLDFFHLLLCASMHDAHLLDANWLRAGALGVRLDAPTYGLIIQLYLRRGEEEDLNRAEDIYQSMRENAIQLTSVHWSEIVKISYHSRLTLDQQYAWVMRAQQAHVLDQMDPHARHIATQVIQAKGEEIQADAGVKPTQKATSARVTNRSRIGPPLSEGELELMRESNPASYWSYQLRRALDTQQPADQVLSLINDIQAADMLRHLPHRLQLDAFARQDDFRRTLKLELERQLQQHTSKDNWQAAETVVAEWDAHKLGPFTSSFYANWLRCYVADARVEEAEHAWDRLGELRPRALTGGHFRLMMQIYLSAAAKVIAAGGDDTPMLVRVQQLHHEMKTAGPGGTPIFLRPEGGRLIRQRWARLKPIREKAAADALPVQLSQRDLEFQRMSDALMPHLFSAPTNRESATDSTAAPTSSADSSYLFDFHSQINALSSLSQSWASVAAGTETSTQPAAAKASRSATPKSEELSSRTNNSQRVRRPSKAESADRLASFLLRMRQVSSPAEAESLLAEWREMIPAQRVPVVLLEHALVACVSTGDWAAAERMRSIPISDDLQPSYLQYSHLIRVYYRAGGEHVSKVDALRKTMLKAIKGKSRITAECQKLWRAAHSSNLTEEMATWEKILATREAEDRKLKDMSKLDSSAASAAVPKRPSEYDITNTQPTTHPEQSQSDADSWLSSPWSTPLEQSQQQQDQALTETSQTKAIPMEADLLVEQEAARVAIIVASREGDVARVEQIVSEFRHSGVTWTHVLFHAWLTCYVSDGRWQAAEAAWDGLSQLQLRPSARTFHLLMRIYLSAGGEQLHKIEPLWMQMETAGPVGQSLLFSSNDCQQLADHAALHNRSEEVKRWTGRAAESYQIVSRANPSALDIIVRRTPVWIPRVRGRSGVPSSRSPPYSSVTSPFPPVPFSSQFSPSKRATREAAAAAAAAAVSSTSSTHTSRNTTAPSKSKAKPINHKTSTPAAVPAAATPAEPNTESVEITSGTSSLQAESVPVTDPQPHDAASDAASDAATHAAPVAAAPTPAPAAAAAAVVVDPSATAVAAVNQLWSRLQSSSVGKSTPPPLSARAYSQLIIAALRAHLVEEATRWAERAQQAKCIEQMDANSARLTRALLARANKTTSNHTHTTGSSNTATQTAAASSAPLQ